jgi:excisionase family DNA binding protein
MDLILNEIRELKKLILDQNLLKKEVINFNEATVYLEVSHSHLYKLTSTGAIPVYKPNGKKLYFKRQELDEWLLRNKQFSKAEIDQQASEYLIKKGGVK